MAETSRPRRSAGNQSYVHLLQAPPDLDDSSGSEDDAGAKEDKGKGKQRAAPVSDADETDVSVYEEEETAPNHGKSKGKGRAAGSSSDDDDGFDDAAASSSDSGPGEEEEEGSVPPSTAARPPTTKLKTRKVAGASDPSPPKLAPRSVPAVPRISIANPKGAPPPASTRAKPPAVEHFVGYGPHYEPPSRWLASGTDSASTAHIVTGPAVTPDVRSRFSSAWSKLPFGPERSVLQDVGWWKGKWDDDEGEMRRRWGGWYPEVQLDLAELDLVSEGCVRPALEFGTGLTSSFHQRSRTVLSSSLRVSHAGFKGSQRQRSRTSGSGSC